MFRSTSATHKSQSCQVKIGRFGKDGSDLKFHEIIEGNLIHLLNEVPVQLNYKFLTRPIKFEGLQREEKEMYPPQAIREMLLNALVHRTYTGAPIQIRVFDRQLSIWNEGALPSGLSIDDLKTDHNSRPRNPSIANACFLAGYIDAWGRGTLKIINACQEYNLPEPTICEKNGGVEIVISVGNQVSNEVGNQVSNEVGNQVSDENVLETSISKEMHAHLKKIIAETKYEPSEKNIKKFGNEVIQLTEREYAIISFCQQPKKRKELLEDCLGVSNQTKNYTTNIEPLLKKGLLKFTLKDRPNSQFQQYQISTKGKVILKIYERLRHEEKLS